MIGRGKSRQGVNIIRPCAREGHILSVLCLTRLPRVLGQIFGREQLNISPAQKGNAACSIRTLKPCDGCECDRKPHCLVSRRNVSNKATTCFLLRVQVCRVCETRKNVSIVDTDAYTEACYDRGSILWLFLFH